MRHRTLQRIFKQLVPALSELGPMVWHDHVNGYANCPACTIGHPSAPHFKTCDCGHCPDRAVAEAAVTQDLQEQDRARITTRS